MSSWEKSFIKYFLAGVSVQLNHSNQIFTHPALFFSRHPLIHVTALRLVFTIKLSADYAFNLLFNSLFFFLSVFLFERFWQFIDSVPGSGMPCVHRTLYEFLFSFYHHLLHYYYHPTVSILPVLASFSWSWIFCSKSIYPSSISVSISRSDLTPSSSQSNINGKLT